MPETNIRTSVDPGLIPPTPPPKRSLNKLWLLLFTVLSAATVLFVLSLKPKKEPNRDPSAPPVSNSQQQTQKQEKTFTTEEVKSILLKNAKINFPESFEKKDQINLAKLPEDLKKFVPAEAKDVQIWPIVYSNQNKGYLIDYQVQNVSKYSFHQNLKVLADNNQWKLLYGTRANSFGFIDLENTNEQMRISYTSFSPAESEQSNLKVSLQIIELKNPSK